MNNERPASDGQLPVTQDPVADASAPLAGAEQAAAEETAKQPPPAESGVMDAVSGVIEGISDVADVVGGVLSIFDV